MINKKKFMVALMSLFESKLKVYTEKTIDVWYNELKDYSEDAVIEGIKRLIHSQDGFISVGKIVEQFSNKDLDISNVWNNIINVAKDGARSWNKLNALEVKVVMNMGGLERFQNATEENLHFMFNEYTKLIGKLSLDDLIKYEGEEKLRRLNADSSSLKLLLKTEGQKIKNKIPEKLKGMLDKIGEKIT